jgi:hypothetical protein
VVPGRLRAASADAILTMRPQFGGVQVEAVAPPRVERREGDMQGTIRRKLEMGRGALAFGLDHPDRSEGYAAALDRLAELLARAGRAAARQETGFVRERGAAARKLALQQTLAPLHLRHLASVAHDAPDPGVLAELGRTLRALDAAIAECDEARRLHVRATAELMLASAAVLAEIAVLDGIVRARFADDPAFRSGWERALRAGAERPASGASQPAA